MSGKQQAPRWRGLFHWIGVLAEGAGFEPAVGC